MDALRGPVERDLKFPVIFEVSDSAYLFRVVGDWAFIDAQFLHKNGDPMGDAYYKDGEFSDTVQALLHRVGGKWKVVTHVTGATDVEWEDWAKKYHAPPEVMNISRPTK